MFYFPSELSGTIKLKRGCTVPSFLPPSNTFGVRTPVVALIISRPNSSFYELMSLLHILIIIKRAKHPR